MKLDADEIESVRKRMQEWYEKDPRCEPGVGPHAAGVLSYNHFILWPFRYDGRDLYLTNEEGAWEKV